MTTSDPLMIAETYLSGLPPLSAQSVGAMLVLSVLIWGVLRAFWGASLVHGRIGLWVLRGCSLAILIAILLGPTIVDEHAGEVKRPSMLYLFDGSQSMLLEQEESTRWQASLDFVSEAQRAAGAQQTGNCQAFRIGHR